MIMDRAPSFKLATYVAGSPNSEELALVLPGKLDTKDYVHIRSHVDHLATLGYYALSFDPPGTWESSGEPKDYSMTNYLQAIRHIIERHDNRPTLAVGHSRGGSMAILAALRLPAVTRFAAIMSNANPVTVPEGVSIHDMIPHKRDVPGRPGEKRAIDLPGNYLYDAAQYELLSGLGRCSKPKLFVYGSRDTEVLESHVRDTFDDAMGPKYLAGIDAAHVYCRQPELIDALNALLTTFDTQTSHVAAVPTQSSIASVSQMAANL